MSKRSMNDSAEDIVASKRQKHAFKVPSEKLALLQEYSRELRAFVKASEKGDSDTEDASLEKLAALNETVLPTLQALCKAEDFPRGGQDGGDKSSQETTASQSTPVPTPSPPSRHETSPTTTTQPAGILPVVANMTPWTPQDIPPTLPPLPPMPDKDLERMVLTHRGLSSDTNYEALEFLGDSFIYYAASEFVTQTFSQLSIGRKSQLREGLLRNANLAQYTVHYGLDKRATLPPEFGDDGKPGGSKVKDKERQKVNGDLFEAYVGALIRARPPEGQPGGSGSGSGSGGYDGVEVTLRWLKSIWAMTLAKDIQREYRRRDEMGMAGPPSLLKRPSLPISPKIGDVAVGSGSNTSTNAPANATTSTAADASASTNAKTDAANGTPQLAAKVRLAALIACNTVVIRYEDAHGKPKRDRVTNLPLFTMAVWVDAWGVSKCLGYGTALGKKEAGQRAAEQALENKKGLKFFIAKKKEADEFAKQNRALQESRMLQGEDRMQTIPQ